MYDSKTFSDILKKTENEIEKIHLLNKTGWEIKASYPKDALEMAMTARVLSQKNMYKEGIASSYRNSGSAYYLLSQYQQALLDLQQAEFFYEELNNIKDLATIIRNIGNVYHSLEENEKSIETYFRALDLTEKIIDVQGTAYNYGNIGYVYQKIGKHSLALEYMQKTYDLLEPLEDNLGLADVLYNMSKVYMDLNDPEKAFKYCGLSLERSEKINHLRGIANAYTGFGNYYFLNKDLNKTIEFYKKALLIAEQMGEESLIFDIHKKLAEAYEHFEKYAEAIFHFKKFETIKSDILKRNAQLALSAINIQSKLGRSEKEKEAYKLENVELAKAKEEIEAQNKKLEMLSIVASETENVILIMDANGKLEWVNESFVKLNAITLEELKKLKGETIYDVSNNPDIRNIINKSILGKVPVTYESFNKTRDGKSVWESSTLTPIFNNEGELSKLIIIDTDVTARKLAEEIIQQKNKDITDSINYAQKIQSAILPDPIELKKHFPESFVLFKPKDIVSGDFYWLAEKDDYIFFAAIDCTGHGVPGGFMSMLGYTLLNEVINEQNTFEPGDILDHLRIKIIRALKQKGESGENKDGMDMCLCRINKAKTELVYAAANNPLWIVRENELLEFAANKFPVGISGGDFLKFDQHSIKLKNEDSIYIFTDGFADQFGGPQGKKFKYKPLKDLVKSNTKITMSAQNEILDETIVKWRGLLEQVDDILIIGIKI